MDLRLFTSPSRGTEYFFIDTNLFAVKNYLTKNEDIVLAGRLVKNTKLKREQIFRQGKGIIEDIEELETAPTSFFVLTLNNHRLLYMKEVAGAPDIKTFQTTSQKFFRDRHRKFIDKKYEANQSLREENPDVEKLTKKKLVQEFPFPELSVADYNSSSETGR